MAKRSKGQKRNNYKFGKKEFLFNFFSLVFMLSVGLYFGYRSLFYYSKQNMKMKVEAQTLNGLVVRNNVLVAGDEVGFHRDQQSFYFYGNVSNNYVLFNNRIFRIIRINEDGSVKMISENSAASFMFGDHPAYKDSNIRQWLVKVDKFYSGIYYDTIYNIKDFVVKTNYYEDYLHSDAVKTTKKMYSDYVTILPIKDYILAGGKNSYLNNGKLSFVLGLSENKSNLYMEEDGTLQECSSLSSYGIRPVITLKANLEVASGDGTPENPYFISVGEHNYVDYYVKLGADLYKVFDDKNGIIKMYKYGYIDNNGEEVYKSYSNTNSIFDLKDKNNIAYYLNNAYYNDLSYKDLLLDTTFYVGEVSDDSGYAYQNIYNKKVVCKIGLLNIFDYNSNNLLEDYFFINTTSEVGSMQYTSHLNGLLDETDVREKRKIVPVISIKKEIIIGGNGLVNDPYVVG